MKIQIQKVMARLSYLQCKRWSLSDLAKVSGIPRSTIVKMASGADISISTRTLEKLVTATFFEIRKVLGDRDRLSDSKLRQLILVELLAAGGTSFLSTKRQVNEASRTALELFKLFPEFADDDITEP